MNQLSPEAIQTLRRIAKTSTNQVAKNGAINKLKAIGVPLEEEVAKEEAKKDKKLPTPKKSESEEEDKDCDDLKDLEEKGKKAGYDFESELQKFKERRKIAKERKEANKNKKPLSPSQKTKKAVEKNTVKVVSEVKKRGKQGNLSEKEITALIEEYSKAIDNLKKMLETLKKGGKFAEGGNIDSFYSAKKQGVRRSKAYSVIETKDGSFKRKNGNQFVNTDGYFYDEKGRKIKTGKGSTGGSEYVEYRRNRADIRKFN